MFARCEAADLDAAVYKVLLFKRLIFKERNQIEGKTMSVHTKHNPKPQMITANRTEENTGIQ